MNFITLKKLTTLKAEHILLCTFNNFRLPLRLPWQLSMNLHILYYKSLLFQQVLAPQPALITSEYLTRYY